MNNRIREVRQNAGLNMQAFGARLGISSPSVSKIESGINNPSEQTIRAICSEFHVNRDWLVDGIGEMHSSRPFVHELLTVLQKNPALKAVLESMIDEMDAEDWAALNNVARKFVEQKTKKETD